MLLRYIVITLLCGALWPSWSSPRLPEGLTKYQQAILLYEAKNYQEALRLLEEVGLSLRGKSEEASRYYYQAYCQFYQKKYVQAADSFQYFCEVFLGDPRVEEAMYYQGYALCLASLPIKLDQTHTHKAVDVLDAYLRRYPSGTYINEATAQLQALNNKLALKAFSNAKYYYWLAHYRAAVVSLSNFQKYFPDASVYMEEAAYLKATSQCLYVQQMKSKAMRPQWVKALQYCREFLVYYPDSPYTVKIGAMKRRLMELPFSLQPDQA